MGYYKELQQDQQQWEADTYGDRTEAYLLDLFETAAGAPIGSPIYVSFWGGDI